MDFEKDPLRPPLDALQRLRDHLPTSASGTSPALES